MTKAQANFLIQDTVKAAFILMAFFFFPSKGLRNGINWLANAGTELLWGFVQVGCENQAIFSEQIWDLVTIEEKNNLLFGKVYSLLFKALLVI